MFSMRLEQGNFKDLALIADFVDTVCEGCIRDSRTLYHIKMAVDEACTNVFEHGYAGEGPLEIEASCNSTRIRFRIRDWGATFDPTAVGSPDPSLSLEDRPLGGLGMHLMRQVMDHIEYSFDEEKGNCLLLEKQLRPPDSHG